MRPLLLATLLLLPASGPAAETILVSEVRVAPGGDYYRSHVEADPIERALAAGTWTPPGDADGWVRLVAGEDGWIEGEELADGYAHATVTVAEGGDYVLEGMGYATVRVNGVPRVGNVYGAKDAFEDWEPRFDFSLLPVRLEPGVNRFLFHRSRFQRIRARLVPARAPLTLNPRDVTLPDLVADTSTDSPGAVVVLNHTDRTVTDARLRVEVEGGREHLVDLPALPPRSVRKVGFPVRRFPLPGAGELGLKLRLERNGKRLDEAELRLRRVLPDGNRKTTFVSDLDGSVQYYGHLPAAADARPKALVLSLHGAGVEAINQSGSYAAKPWAHVFAPTNRRPFGFNWEGWGRHDALEVLLRGIRELDVDPHRVYLTGHSMGGHGAWHLGTLYPDLFAAVGPSAGWISFWSYRPASPGEPPDGVEALVQRATLSSRTLELSPNLESLGVYVLHGDADDNVPVEQARLMVDRLEGFHRDLQVHEEPGAGHWWDLSDEPGVDCVDWAPMFDFFVRHRRPSLEEVRRVRFTVADPGISAWNAWVCLARPREPFVTASIDAFLEPGGRRITAATDNAEVVGFDVEVLGPGTITAVLDGSEVAGEPGEDGVAWFLRDGNGAWSATPERPRTEKGPHRYGSFRDVLRNRVQFVVATRGTPEENALAYASARRDAEFLWYQGNGAVPVLPDTLFDPADEPDRNVVLYGNADTHGHWAALVDDAVEVRRDEVRVGERRFAAGGLGVLAVRPRPDSDTGSVGMVAATGPAGTRLLWGRPYLAPGFAYPDLTLFEDLGDGRVVRFAGFFGNDWSVERGTFATVEGR